MVAKDCGVVPMALLSCCKVYDRAMWLLLCYEGVAWILGWLLGPSGKFLWHFLGDWWSTAKLELGV